MQKNLVKIDEIEKYIIKFKLLRSNSVNDRRIWRERRFSFRKEVYIREDDEESIVSDMSKISSVSKS